MSTDLHETCVPVRHRFAIGDRIRSGVVDAERIITGVFLGTGGRPCYEFEATPRCPHHYVAWYDKHWVLAPPTKKVRVYTITVEAEEDTVVGSPALRGSRLSDAGMVDAVCVGIGDQVPTNAPLYHVTRCESTVEEREV